MRRCLTLAHSMPFVQHSVQNRDTARNVWMAMLHVSNRAWRTLQRRLYVKDMAEKAQPLTARASWQSGTGDQFGPSHSAFTGRAERFLVTLPTVGDLFICAKDLFVAAMERKRPRPLKARASKAERDRRLFGPSRSAPTEERL